MDEKQVIISIEYHGHFIVQAHKKSEELTVYDDFQQGIDQIKCHLKLNYAIESGFMTLINNMSLCRLIKENPKIVFEKNDIVQIIPIASGG